MNKASVLFTALLFLLFLSACTETARVTQPTALGETVKLRLIVEGRDGIILDREITLEKGTNAFDAMKANADVRFVEYDFGPFIKEIEGVKPQAGEYWALYVNEEIAMQGISAYTLEEDTEIKWKIEPQQAFAG